MSGAGGPAWTVDAAARVRGRIGFVNGLEEPGMLHGRLLRSRVAHGRIAAIRADRARRMPGVRAILTGADLQGLPGVDPWYGPVYRDQPALAIDTVRYVGEPIVAVAADHPDAAREALDALEVEIEPLPAVFDIETALASDELLVHREARRAGTYSPVGAAAGSNVCHRFRLRKGDVEAALAGADHVFEDTFATPPIQHAPLETHDCLARIDGRRVTVWSATQTPHGLRTQLAELLGRASSDIRVIVPPIGGAFGGKGHAKIEPIAVLLALAAGRPVRLVLERDEEFVTLTRHGSLITLRTGVDRSGTIVARSADCRFNTGAYADIGPRVAQFGALAASGPYRVEHLAVDAVAVYTNLPPAGAFRGFGFPQVAWAHESQMDMIANRLGIDPCELRLRNLLADGDRFATGEVMEDCYYRELLEEAAADIRQVPAVEPGGADDIPVAGGRFRRGVGLACTTKATVVPTMATATAKLNDDGSLDVAVSSVDMGQGVRTALARLAAAELGLDVDRVHVSLPDTDLTPYDQMTSASRSTFAMGGAVAAAVADIRQQLVALAAEELEVAPTDLEVVAGRIQVRGSPSTSRGLDELVRRSRQGNLLGRGLYQRGGGLDPETGQGVGSVHWSPGVGAAEVEVDMETGRVRLLRYHAGTYAGRIVNPLPAALQIEGCVAFGVGQALCEELIFDEGQLQNGTMADYLITSVRDMPVALQASVLERADAHEVHGLGESALPPVAPAIGNAIFAATGARVTELPITPERVLRTIREAAAESARVGPA